MQTDTSIEDIVRKSYNAFLTKDKEAMDAILADDDTFTSPRDDHISKAEFFDRCFPGSNLFVHQIIEKIFIKGNEAFVVYFAELTDGSKFRDVEFFKVEDNKIKEVQVYLEHIYRKVSNVGYGWEKTCETYVTVSN